MLQDVLTALRARDAAAALAAASRWIAAEPQSADALFWLAQAQGAAGDLAAAAEALDHALALAPQRADLLALRGYLDLQGRDFAKAEVGLKAALAEDPNQLPAYIALAHLALARGDRAEFERLVAYAQRIEPEHPRVQLLEALLAARREGQADRVLPLLTAAAERAPNDPQVLSVLGIAFLERRHFAFAEQTLRRVLALAPASPVVHSALISALEAQNKPEDALAIADAWARRAGTPIALWSRAQLRAGLGDRDGARSDVQAILSSFPRHAPALELAMELLGQSEGPDSVRAALEARIGDDPQFAYAWELRWRLQAPGEAHVLLQRWLDAMPQHPGALEAAALLAEREGRLGDGLDFAERALAAEPRLLESALLRARATPLLVPEAAVARMDNLLAAATTPEQARLLSGWQAHAFHRVGRFEEALRAWGRMWMARPPLGLPLPNPQPAETAAPSPYGGAGVLFWGPPGSRVERLQAAVLRTSKGRLRMDRFGPAPLNDGFDALRYPPGHALAGSAERWRDALEVRGVNPATVIDALPFWDGWTQATLHGTVLVAVLRDPRDLLLNWMAWGSTFGFAFSSPSNAAAWLHRQLDQLLAAEAANPKSVVRIDADRLDRDSMALGAELAGALGLDAGPDIEAALALATTPNGAPTDFAAGTWRQYAEPMKALFAPLGEMAVRLGYPAE
jgi:tetratricopeptide (TPR) repeat protein